VAPHPGGEVVEREQVGERGRARRLLLKGVEDAKLAQQQRLVPPAKAGQHLPEAAAQPRLGRGRRGRGALHARQGRGDRRELRDPGLHLPGRLMGYRLRLAVAQPGHDLRKLLVGEVTGRGREAGGLPGQPSGEGPDERDYGKGDDEAGPGHHHRLDKRAVRGRVDDVAQRAGEHRAGHGGPDEHQAEGGHGQPGGEVGPDRATGAARRSLTGGTWYPHAVTPVTSGTQNPCASLAFLLLSTDSPLLI
jgi:hypothetical protein